ncbi:MAG: NIPSNAP family protein [Janthinobacterium lividum]
MKKNFLVVLLLLLCGKSVLANPTASRPGYFELKVYHFTTPRQEAVIDSFLHFQYTPFMHGAGVGTVGVFKPISNDTAKDKRVYVFTPYQTLAQWEKMSAAAKKTLTTATGAYANAYYKSPAYARLETIFIKAFDEMPAFTAPKLEGPKNDHVFELRSYEGPSEKIFRTKVKMFNTGGEMKLFSRLGFNAVFYGEVLAGAKMPNLMYMTSFNNMQVREEHWKNFGSDPEWKKLSALPEYQNNVSHIDIVFLRPAPYSDL